MTHALVAHGFGKFRAGSGGVPAPYPVRGVPEPAPAAGAPAVPVERGQLTVYERVSVVFDIAQ